jgi:hypothetical protein
MNEPHFPTTNVFNQRNQTILSLTGSLGLWFSWDEVALSGGWLHQSIGSSKHKNLNFDNF